jgi:hypothetical protein
MKSITGGTNSGNIELREFENHGRSGLTMTLRELE